MPWRLHPQKKYILIFKKWQHIRKLCFTMALEDFWHIFPTTRGKKEAPRKKAFKQALSMSITSKNFHMFTHTLLYSYFNNDVTFDFFLCYQNYFSNNYNASRFASKSTQIAKKVIEICSTTQNYQSSEV